MDTASERNQLHEQLPTRNKKHHERALTLATSPFPNRDKVPRLTGPLPFNKQRPLRACPSRRSRESGQGAGCLEFNLALGGRGMWALNWRWDDFRECAATRKQDESSRLVYVYPE